MTIRKPNRRSSAELKAFVNGGLCTSSGKVRFLDEPTAERAKRWLAQKDPEHARLVVYQHGACGDWHVGHRAAAPEPTDG